MKANRRTLALASATGVALLLASCVGPAQTPIARAPLARALPPPPPPPDPVEWHDMPATAGIWQWSRAGSLTTARFFAPNQRALFSMTCDRAAGSIALARAGQSGPAAMSIQTTSLTRTLPAQSGSLGMIAALSARDPLLDAMAYSRGRFAVELPGLATLYLPSWPEVARVIEDCRG